VALPNIILHGSHVASGKETFAPLGYCSQANAQERCPELTRLRSEAAEAIKPRTSVAPSDRCGAYNRFSMAWGAIAQYANDHRELCDISIVSLSEFEKRHREAEKARDNVCAGPPSSPISTRHH